MLPPRPSFPCLRFGLQKDALRFKEAHPMPRPDDPPEPPRGGGLRTLRPADLRTRVAFDLRPGPDDLSRLARDLGLLGLSKVRLSGHAQPAGGGVDLDARLGATVVQPCSVTLVPVTTRIDERVQRRYRPGLAAPEPGSETEMPEDDSLEPLPDTVDLADVLAEALALALPPFPRAPGAAFGSAVFAAPGVAPLTDADASPFAVLRGLTPGEDPPT
jgi:uncharacterized metal-binding protein YceD (DUF177 family)